MDSIPGTNSVLDFLTKGEDIPVNVTVEIDNNSLLKMGALLLLLILINQGIVYFAKS